MSTSNESYLSLTTSKEIIEVLSLNENDYTVYKIVKSSSTAKTAEILFLHIFNNYRVSLYIFKGNNYLIFNKNAMDQNLLDVIIDMPLVPLPISDLKLQIIAQLIN